MLPPLIQIVPSYQWVTVEELNHTDKLKVYFQCKISCPIQQKNIHQFCLAQQLDTMQKKIKEFVGDQKQIKFNLDEEKYCYIGFECSNDEIKQDFIIIDQFEGTLIEDQIYSINGEVCKLFGVDLNGVRVELYKQETKYNSQLFKEAYEATKIAQSKRNMNRVKYFV